MFKAMCILDYEGCFYGFLPCVVILVILTNVTTNEIVRYMSSGLSHECKKQIFNAERKHRKSNVKMWKDMARNELHLFESIIGCDFIE